MMGENSRMGNGHHCARCTYIAYSNMRQMEGHIDANANKHTHTHTAIKHYGNNEMYSVSYSAIYYWFYLNIKVSHLTIFSFNFQMYVRILHGKLQLKNDYEEISYTIKIKLGKFYTFHLVESAGMAHSIFTTRTFN